MPTRKRASARKPGNGEREQKRERGRAESSPTTLPRSSKSSRSRAPKAATSEWLTESLRELNPRQDRFCQEYLIDLNGTQSAKRSGYSAATSGEIAYELLKKPEIQKRIAVLMEERATRTRITKDRVITRIAQKATYDIADAFDERGAVRPLHDMPPELRDAIAGIEVQELNIDGVPVGSIKKIKLADKLRADELLGRHLKLFTDRLEVNDKTGLAERMKKARGRKS